MISTRRTDLDWLRVLATYLLFVFHVSKVFDPAPFYHIRNADTSMVMLILCGFIGLWHMPLFFLLAGWSIHASLSRRSVQRFLRERVTKLLVPLLMGCILFGPVIKYLELKTGLDIRHTGLWVTAAQQESFKTVIPRGLPEFEPIQEGFFEFLPSFFTQLDRFTWSHLWFLAYLFSFTLLYLPLFLWLLRSSWTMERVKALWVYLPILPLSLIQVTLRPHWPGIQNLYNDWANFAYYSLYLILGFALARYPAWEQIIHQEWLRSLGLSLIALVVLLASVFGWVTSGPLILIVVSAAGWCWIVGLLGWAYHHWQQSSRQLNYLVQSAYPIYLLHQVAIVGIGYWLVQLPLGLLTKWVLLMLSSLMMVMLIYEWVVQPLPWLHFIFAIKPKPRPSH